MLGNNHSSLALSLLAPVSDSMVQSTPFRDCLGSDMVDVYVGPESVHFRVHEMLLCRDSRPFSAMFKGGFQETTGKSACLPEDEPDIFDAYTQWAYGNSLKDLNTKELIESKAASGPVWDRVRLFCFAHKYFIGDLADLVLNSIIEAYGDNKYYPSTEAIILAYKSTPRDSGLRLYMARLWLYQLLMGAPPKHSVASVETLANVADFSRDVFSLLLKIGDRLPTSPYKCLRCDYHCHGKDQPCPCRIQAA